jgi:type III secretion system YscD/HrpQ family protein
VRNAHGDDITDELELTFGLPVELGSVWISVDKEDAPWPNPHSVMPIKTRQAVEDEEGDYTEPDLEATTDQSDETLAAVAPLFPPAEKKRPVLPYLAIVALVLLVLLVCGVGIAAMLELGKPEPVQATTMSAPSGTVETVAPAEALAVLKDFPNATLSVQKVEGAWTVRGFLQTAIQGQELSARLASVEPVVKVNVFVEEELVQSARRLLSAERSAEQVKVKSAAGGLVLLTGAASSSADVEKLRQVLLAGVAGVNEVKSEILMPEELRKQLKERIAAAGLADRLAVTSQEPELTLVGRLTMEEIRRWEELLVTFNRDYGNVLPIRATVSRFVPKPAVGVQAIVGGAVPYIVTPTGEHINQGGDVNGHTLVSVKDGEVVFEGRQRVRIAR